MAAHTRGISVLSVRVLCCAQLLGSTHDQALAVLQGDVHVNVS